LGGVFGPPLPLPSAGFAGAIDFLGGGFGRGAKPPSEAARPSNDAVAAVSKVLLAILLLIVPAILPVLAYASSPDPSWIPGIYNDYGQPAVNVRLRISGVDAAGRELKGTTTFPVGDTVPANGRAYFDVQVPESQSYRVSVAAFDFVEFPGT
jgi:hypothetical protein